jgi:hypothetical protein
VKVDTSSVTIDVDGTIHAKQYSLPIATDKLLGGVKVDDDTITVDPLTGVISAAIPEPYDLPVASETALGGIKTLQQTATVSVPVGMIASTQRLSVQVAADNRLGVVKPDNTTISIGTDGTISAVGGGDRSKVNLSSQCDGSKLVFTGTFPRSESALVFYNGLCMLAGVNYSITDTTLTLTTTPPVTGSLLWVELF